MTASPTRASSTALIALAVLALPLPSQSGWAQWSPSSGGNGHWYLAVHVPGGITWADARAKAQALGGDLASITTATENAYVFLRVADPVFWRQPATGPVRLFGPWIGGFQPPGSPEPFGQWSWVSGEPWFFTSWDAGEPNNLNGNEDHLHFYAPGTTPVPRWNDLRQTQLCPGFVVESAVAPVAAYVALGAGCAPAGQVAPLLAPVVGELPRLGSTSRLRVTGYPATAAIGCIVVGLGNRYAATPGGPVALPIDLSPLGWSGCSQLVQVDALSAFAPLGGSFEIALSIPAQTGLLGEAIFAQGLVLEAADTRLSNAVAGYIGP